MEQEFVNRKRFGVIDGLVDSIFAIGHGRVGEPLELNMFLNIHHNYRKWDFCLNTYSAYITLELNTRELGCLLKYLA